MPYRSQWKVPPIRENRLLSNSSLNAITTHRFPNHPLMPKIIIHHPDGTSAKYGLNGPTFTIGRAAGNDIVLPAGAASSHHAVLNLNETGDYTVTDLESTNKTKVNAVPIQTRPLRSGDTLLFGDIAGEYVSEIVSKLPLGDDQPTQIYDRSALPAALPEPRVKPPGVIIAPQVIHRPVSTTARRSTHSSDGGCFALIVFAFVLPAAFFAGLVIRHHQDKGQWFWSFLTNYMSS
jgi:FHA domain